MTSKFPLIRLASACGVAAVFYGGLALAETKAEAEEQRITTTVKQYLTEASKVNLQGLKKHLDWPMTLVATSPVHVDTASTIRNEAEFDARFSKHYNQDAKISAPLAEDLASTVSDLKVQIVNDELATVTYKCRVGAGKAEAGSVPAHTLNMLTVLRKRPSDKNWKVSYSTFPM